MNTRVDIIQDRDTHTQCSKNGVCVWIQTCFENNATHILHICLSHGAGTQMAVMGRDDKGGACGTDPKEPNEKRHTCQPQTFKAHMSHFP